MRGEARPESYRGNITPNLPGPQKLDLTRTLQDHRPIQRQHDHSSARAQTSTVLRKRTPPTKPLPPTNGLSKEGGDGCAEAENERSIAIAAAGAQHTKQT